MSVPAAGSDLGGWGLRSRLTLANSCSRVTRQAEVLRHSITHGLAGLNGDSILVLLLDLLLCVVGVDVEALG